MNDKFYKKQDGSEVTFDKKAAENFKSNSNNGAKSQNQNKQNLKNNLRKNLLRRKQVDGSKTN
jgi:hypothetical protein